MRLRISVRGAGCTLRGFIETEHVDVAELAAAMVPFGIVLASVAEPEDTNEADLDAYGESP